MTKTLPFLYITTLGRPHPQAVLTGHGTKPFIFPWEENFEYRHGGILQRGAHVRRYASQEAFDAEQDRIIGRQTAWPVYFGNQTVQGSQAGEWASRQIIELKTEVARKDARINNLEQAVMAMEQELANSTPNEPTIPPTALLTIEEREAMSPSAAPAMPHYHLGEPLTGQETLVAELGAILGTPPTDAQLEAVATTLTGEGYQTPAGHSFPTVPEAFGVSENREIVSINGNSVAVTPLDTPPAPVALDTPPPPADAPLDSPADAMIEEIDAASPLPPTSRPSKKALRRAAAQGVTQQMISDAV